MMGRAFAERKSGATGQKVGVDPSEGRPLLSVIVPVFNEQDTIGELLKRVLAVECAKQLIVVDDCSSDLTQEILRRWDESTVQVIRHEHNRGKGAAIRTGLQYARGEFIIIQDADLEYDPQDYVNLVTPLLSGDVQVVYGSRYLRPGARHHTVPNLFRLGVSLLNLCVRVIYGARLTDEATCYKAFSTDVLRAMELECERFEFCSEVTAKACRMGLRILEVPIRYHPRTVSAGKKIRYRDGLTCIRTLWRWRNWESPSIATRAGHPSAEGSVALKRSRPARNSTRLRD